MSGQIILTPHQRPDTCYLPAMTEAEWHDILVAQGWRCFYCGNFMRERAIDEREIPYPDHLYPDSHSGCSCAGNTVAACGICNRMKQGKFIVDFLADNPHFLNTMGQFSTRILFLKRGRFFWNHLSVQLRKLADDKAMDPPRKSPSRERAKLRRLA